MFFLEMNSVSGFKFLILLILVFGWVSIICGFFWKIVVMVMMGMLLVIVLNDISVFVVMKKLSLLVISNIWLFLLGLFGMMLMLRLYFL